MIGRGGFGKVWRVVHKKTLKEYALKEMSKFKIIDKKSELSIKSERDLLSQISHPFITNLQYSFQDNNKVYLVMDLFTGGDLRYHLGKYRHFSENQTKFILACIILALEYLHINHIIHRDLKPENILLDHNGYAYLTDFGIAKVQGYETNAKNTSGTPAYMAPEVLCGQEHTTSVDYFALGVIAFELMNGYRPYQGKSRKEIKENVMAKQVQIKKCEIPSGWSVEAADFINQCIQRKPSKRLGNNNIKEIKEHSWFKHYNWKDLYLHRIKAEFYPKETDNYDVHYCNMVDKIDLQTQERYNKIATDYRYKTAFDDFYYFSKDDSNPQIVTIINPHIIYEEEEQKEEEREKERHQIELQKELTKINYDEKDESNLVANNILNKYTTSSTNITTNMGTDMNSFRLRRQQSFDFYNHNINSALKFNHYGSQSSRVTPLLYRKGIKNDNDKFSILSRVSSIKK